LVPSTGRALKESRKRSGTVLLLAAVLAIGLECLPAGSAGKTPDYGYPVPAGEKLFYSIYWDPPWYLFFFPSMHAGDAELSIEEGAEYQGRPALRIRFKVDSTGTLSKISGMEIHDEFLFLTDPETLCTFSASKKILEGKRKRTIDVQYLPQTRQLHMLDYDESVEPRKLKRDIVKDDIPECVQDPLSGLYDLRRRPLHDDAVIAIVLGHDDLVKQVESRVEKLVALDTTAGKVAAWRLRTISLVEGLFRRGGEFRIWVSADERQVPLQFEVKVKLGRVLGKLEKTEIR
jgi:hypothetical protein